MAFLTFERETIARQSSIVGEIAIKMIVDFDGGTFQQPQFSEQQ